MDTQVKYLWPPNWDGIPMTGELGRIVLPVNKRWTVELLGLATESEDETNVRKIVLADMAKQDGTAPSKMVVDKIEYDCSGFSNIKLLWERDLDVVIARFPGSSDGVLDYTKEGGRADDGTGETGDLMLTTLGGDTNDSYSIRIEFRLK